MAASTLVTLAIVATRSIVVRLVGVVVAGFLSIMDLGEDLPDLLEGCCATDLEGRNTSLRKEEKGNIITEDSRSWTTARVQTEEDTSGC